MEGKNQTILVVLIAVVIVVAIFSSFGMNLFYNSEAAFSDAPPAQAVSPTPEQEGELTGVSVTPQNVQSVIATLVRPESYQRTVTVTYAGVDTPTVSQIWVSDGWVRTDTSMPNGMVRHTLVGNGTLYAWYGSSRLWVSAPADSETADLEGAGIPGYEDILEVDQASITQAEYTTYNDMPCIYVAWSGSDGSQRSYYISVEAGSMGLLVGAEVYQGEVLVLSMTATAAQPPNVSTGMFQLPDGTDPTQAPEATPAQG